MSDEGLENKVVTSEPSDDGTGATKEAPGIGEHRPTDLPSSSVDAPETPEGISPIIKKHCGSHKQFYNYCWYCRKASGLTNKKKSVIGDEIRNKPFTTKADAILEKHALERKIEKFEMIPPNVEPGDFEYKKGQGPKTALKQRTGEIGYKEYYGFIGKGKIPIRLFKNVILVRHPKGQNSRLCWETLDYLEKNLEDGVPFDEALNACQVPKEVWEKWKEKDFKEVKSYSGVVERLENARRRGRAMIIATLREAFLKNPNSDAGKKYLELCDVSEPVESGINKIELVMVGGRDDVPMLPEKVIDVRVNEADKADKC